MTTAFLNPEPFDSAQASSPQASEGGPSFPRQSAWDDEKPSRLTNGVETELELTRPKVSITKTDAT